MGFKKIFLTLLLIFLIESLAWALYDPHGRLVIKNLNFCVSKPQAVGRFEPAAEDGFRIGDTAYLYMEAENCKSEIRERAYELFLIADMDIYYEDGTLVYGEKDVKSFSPKSPREFSRAMLWIKIDTQFLKAGEYKVEIRVRDENSGKDAFALKKFRIYGK